VKALFADTSFCVALLSPDDAHHSKAKEIAVNHLRLFITTEYVFVKAANFFRHGIARNVIQIMIANPIASEDVAIVTASTTLFTEGLTLFKSRLDKTWPLTDCISFEVMKRQGFTEALTADHHFRQDGFKAILLH
jgi:predicted nucleic acid-binding protein